MKEYFFSRRKGVCGRRYFPEMSGQRWVKALKKLINNGLGVTPKTETAKIVALSRERGTASGETEVGMEFGSVPVYGLGADADL